MTTELKGLLKKTLPDYMVPAYFVALEKLPLMPSGKIDRRALCLHLTALDRNWKKLILLRVMISSDAWLRFLKNFSECNRLVFATTSSISEDTRCSQFVWFRRSRRKSGNVCPLVSFFQGANIEYLASSPASGCSFSFLAHPSRDTEGWRRCSTVLRLQSESKRSWLPDAGSLSGFRSAGLRLADSVSGRSERR